VNGVNRKKKQSIKRGVLLGVIAILVIASVLFTHRLFTAEYPTHSDVFFMGVECGILMAMLLVCLFLICLLLYRLVMHACKQKSGCA